ncbi:MAG TPA: H-X9-DG-CTERM domain-containing protein [Verrucomicrobiae bacterium]|nr:H-X9-DG-CTERM domain-containing protein [Verrucomicrobiae bacterium]
MSNELASPKILLCPYDDRQLAPAIVLANGGTVSDFANLSNSNISYFIELDADETSPAMLLSGDRNLVTNGADVVPGLVVLGTNSAMGWSAKMHNGKGNILLADGSVQRTTPSSLQTLLSNTGTNMNRLAVP